MALARVLREPMHVCTLSDTCERCVERLFKNTMQGQLDVILTCNIYKGRVKLIKFKNDRVWASWNGGNNVVQVKPCAVKLPEVSYVPS